MYAVPVCVKLLMCGNHSYIYIHTSCVCCRCTWITMQL